MEICTHLMFDGGAEEALNFYVGLVPGSEIREIQRYDSGDLEGKLQYGSLTLAGREFIFIDSPVPQDFGFTPAMSIFVECETSSELEQLFKSLEEGGQVLMPLDNYGFSQRFGWLSDRFGVSWQINLP